MRSKQGPWQLEQVPSFKGIIQTLLWSQSISGRQLPLLSPAGEWDTLSPRLPSTPSFRAAGDWHWKPPPDCSHISPDTRANGCTRCCLIGFCRAKIDSSVPVTPIRRKGLRRKHLEARGPLSETLLERAARQLRVSLLSPPAAEINSWSLPQPPSQDR